MEVQCSCGSAFLSCLPGVSEREHATWPDTGRDGRVATQITTQNSRLPRRGLDQEGGGVFQLALSQFPKPTQNFFRFLLAARNADLHRRDHVLLTPTGVLMELHSEPFSQVNECNRDVTTTIRALGLRHPFLSASCVRLLPLGAGAYSMNKEEKKRLSAVIRAGFRLLQRRSRLTQIVRVRDAFWQERSPMEKPQNWTKVWLCNENKGIAGTQPRPR
jgi:hypothetical protein